MPSAYSLAKMLICTPRLTSSFTFSQSIRFYGSWLLCCAGLIIRETVRRLRPAIFAMPRSERPCLNNSNICVCIAVVTLYILNKVWEIFYFFGPDRIFFIIFIIGPPQPIIFPVKIFLKFEQIPR